MKIGPVIFFIFHYIIKFMLLTVILTGELLADRNGLMLIYIVFFYLSAYNNDERAIQYNFAGC